eukprot:TRINITY_DN6976_c0_g1_i2.p1 TRINITY_DN6976_c0_g1~~TRINITY_DN6976_c0_g1_i2.p1  ORF type:complete len:720 (+),score=73.92 TRINITY_DN6976_c0_g1_i2:1452-3611(+)
MRQQPLWGDLVIGNLIPSSTKLVGEDQPWSGVSVDICTPFAGRVKGVSLISAAGGPFRLQLLRSQGDNKPWVLVDQTANLVFSSEGLHEVSVDWVVEAGVCLGIAALGGFLPLQSSIGFGTKWYTGSGVVQTPGSSISLGTEASLSFAIELRLVPFPLPQPPIDRGVWYGTGFGGPLRTHSDFERVGGMCPAGFTATGLRFRRAGCGQSKRFTDGDITSPPCNGTAETVQDGTEGLVVELKCLDLGVLVSSTWKATGVGTPLTRHMYFDRVGGMCPPQTVLSGLRFARGGAGIDVPWTDKILDYSVTADRGQSSEGLVLELLCANFPSYEAPVWLESGVGTPLPTHASFERVGGECGPGKLAVGLTFERGGYGLFPSSWTDKVLDRTISSNENTNSDADEGLLLKLLCADYNFVVPTRSQTGTPTPAATPTGSETRTPVPPPRPQDGNPPIWLQMPYLAIEGGAVAVLLLGIASFAVWRFRRSRRRRDELAQPLADFSSAFPNMGLVPEDEGDGIGSRVSSTYSNTGEQRFRLVEGAVVGKGGFGIVYRGVDLLTSVPVAMKELLASRPGGGSGTKDSRDARPLFTPTEMAKAVKELQREVAFLGRLSHPNIVQYLGTQTIAVEGREMSRVFIVMELLLGGTARQMLQRSRSGLSVEFALRLLRDVLEGLSYLHQHRIVHRDIKPENVCSAPPFVVASYGFRVAVIIDNTCCYVADRIT